MGDKGSACFFEMLKTYKVLFKKSQLPVKKSAKDDALCSLQADYMRKLGQEVTTVQLRKKIQNMKNHVKKKSDIRATGNKPIILKEWERELLDLLEEDSNPVFNKIPGAIDVSIGVEREKQTGKTEKYNFNEETEKTKEIPKTKKIKLADETEETKNLTLPELQRLVLLRQLKLLNIKIRQREHMIEESLEPKALKIDNENNEQYSIEILDEMYSTDV